MICLHCARHISPAPALPNGSRHEHDDTRFRLCNPAEPGSEWASPAEAEPATRDAAPCCDGRLGDSCRCECHAGPKPQDAGRDRG